MVKRSWIVGPVLCLLLFSAFPASASAQGQANDPRSVLSRIYGAIGSGNVDVALELFSEDAVFRQLPAPPGQSFTGRTQIRSFLQGFLADGGRLEVDHAPPRPADTRRFLRARSSPPAAEMTERPMMATYVLIHGSFFDASCWDRVAGALRDRGHAVVTPDLPGHGADATPAPHVTLQSYADVICHAVGALAEPVILVGHSMGGVAISQAAEQCPGGIARLVYVASFLLGDGEALFGWTQAHPEFSSSLLGPNLTVDQPAAVLRVAPDKVREVFMADADADDAERALARLRPDPLAPNVTPLGVTAERWGKLPRSYVETTEDRVIPIAAQRVMVSRTPVDRVHSLAASHAPFFSRAAELADILAAMALEPPPSGAPAGRA